VLTVAGVATPAARSAALEAGVADRASGEPVGA
jgi:hypothetical protein